MFASFITSQGKVSYDTKANLDCVKEYYGTLSEKYPKYAVGMFQMYVRLERHNDIPPNLCMMDYLVHMGILAKLISINLI